MWFYWQLNLWIYKNIYINSLYSHIFYMWIWLKKIIIIKVRMFSPVMQTLSCVYLWNYRSNYSRHYGSYCACLNCWHIRSNYSGWVSPTLRENIGFHGIGTTWKIIRFALENLITFRQSYGGLLFCTHLRQFSYVYQWAIAG